MLAIYKKDVRSAFHGMSGWVVCAFVVFVIGLYFMALCLSGGYGEFGYVLNNSMFMFLVVVPLLSMRSMVEERRQKTDQLLLTSPVSISGIVWGKYLALLTIYGLPLLVAAVCPLIMTAFGTVSLLRAYGCLLAFFLLGAATLAIGLFMSSLTENQIIAALCTFGALILVYLMPSIASLISSTTFASTLAFTLLALVVCVLVYLMTKSLVLATGVFCLAEVILFVLTRFTDVQMEGSFGKMLNTLALFERFSTFVNGVFDLTAIVYYISIALLFVFLTTQGIEKRRWS